MFLDELNFCNGLLVDIPRLPSRDGWPVHKKLTLPPGMFAPRVSHPRCGLPAQGQDPTVEGLVHMRVGSQGTMWAIHVTADIIGTKIFRRGR